MRLSVPCGSFTLLAEGPVWSYTSLTINAADFGGLYAAARDARRMNTPETPAPNDNWTSYDQLQFVRDHRVVDAAGAVVSPIIDEIALLNSGYVLTWPQNFWREGFCIHDGRVAFISVGTDEGYHAHSGMIRYVTGGHGVVVSREGIEPYLSEERVEVSFHDIKSVAQMSLHIQDWPREAE